MTLTGAFIEPQNQTPEAIVRRLVDEHGPTKVAEALVAALLSVRSPNGARLLVHLYRYLAGAGA